MSWNYANSYIKYPEKHYKPGHQKLAKEEVDQMVVRLSANKVYPEGGGAAPADPYGKKLTAAQVEKLLDRIADKDINMSKTPDRQRTGADNYFNAWKANEILSSMYRP